MFQGSRRAGRPWSLCRVPPSRGSGCSNCYQAPVARLQASRKLRTSCFLWDSAASWWCLKPSVSPPCTDPGGGLPCQSIDFPSVSLLDHRPVLLPGGGGIRCPGGLQGRCRGREVHGCGHRCVLACICACSVSQADCPHPNGLVRQSLQSRQPSRPLPPLCSLGKADDPEPSNQQIKRVVAKGLGEARGLGLGLSLH